MVDSAISLYIHIPFCRSKCRYCDFYSIKDDSDADRYIRALSGEWRNVKLKHDLGNVKIKTVYFGGGTPSLLPIESWRKLGDLFISGSDLSDNYECSVECNPDSFTPELAAVLAEIGVTRLTFGIQSLNDGELRILGRRHSLQRALEVINHKSLDMFKSVGADLMYGIPGQSVFSLENSLDNVLSSPYIKHLSAYELTIGSSTSFGRHLSMLPLPDEDIVLEMTMSVLEKTTKSGMIQYEISNYAKPGNSCMHNECYWDHSDYIGLGCAAHSYLDSQRWSNVKNVNEYINSIEYDRSPVAGIERIDSKTLAKEMVFLGLRRVCGINEDDFEEKTGFNFKEYADKEKLDLFQKQDLLDYSKPWWRLTGKGLLLADGISRELI